MLRQFLTGPLLQNENAVRFEQVGELLIFQERTRELSAALRLFIGRISQDDVEALVRRRRFQKGKYFLPPHTTAQLRANEVLLDGENGGAIFIDEKSGGRTAAERFDAEGAGAGKEIEHTRIHHPIAKAGKNRSLYAVHRR